MTMKINRDSNIYTVCYAIVLVLVVGVALSVVCQALRPDQLENMANDKKRQILAAALITPRKGESVSQLYADHIVRAIVVNSRGYVTNSPISAFDVKPADEIRKPAAKRLLPVFECKTDDGLKYILPTYGAGLWGPIWGYVAMNADGSTIYGAYFAHQGETPGLGAEIAKPQFSDQFKGKTLFEDGQFEAIKVVKTGQEPAEGSYVHAISGGTITSQGVQRMLANSLEPYDAFFKKLRERKITGATD